MLTKLFHRLFKTKRRKPKRHKHTHKNAYVPEIDKVKPSEYNTYVNWRNSMLESRSFQTRSDLNYFYIWVKMRRDELATKILNSKHLDLFPKFDAFQEILTEMEKLLGKEDELHRR